MNAELILIISILSILSIIIVYIIIIIKSRKNYPTTTAAAARPTYPTTTMPAPTTTAAARPTYPTTTMPAPTTTMPAPTTTMPAPTTTAARPTYPTTTMSTPTTTIPAATTTMPTPTTTMPAPTTTAARPTYPTTTMPAPTTTAARPTYPTTTMPAPISPPQGSIKGTWSSFVGCGSDYFNLISLASATPQNYPLDNKTFTDFFSDIMGVFDKDMSSGSTKYLISIGGSNSTAEGWTSLFKNLYIKDNLASFMKMCKCRGIVGVDFDLELVNDTSPLVHIVDMIKSIDPSFLVMYSVMLSEPKSFGNLISNTNYDYLSLMLYEGGMYKADNGGDGCDWDAWAELILSKGTAGCLTPATGQSYTLSRYIQDANLGSIVPSKVLLGLIIDTTGLRLNSSIQNRANFLINKYGAGGSMIWVLPGWAQTDSAQSLQSLGYKFDLSKCGSGSQCTEPKNKCVAGMKGNCVATSCGSKNHGVTDSACAPCATGQTWYPCGSLNYCEIEDTSGDCA